MINRWYGSRDKERDLKIYHLMRNGAHRGDVAKAFGIVPDRVHKIFTKFEYVIQTKGFECPEDAVFTDDKKYKNIRMWSDWYGTYDKWKKLDIYNSFNQGVRGQDLAEYYGIGRSAVSNELKRMRKIIFAYGFESPEDEFYAPAAVVLEKKGYMGCRHGS